MSLINFGDIPAQNAAETQDNQAMMDFASYPGTARTKRECGTVCNSHKRYKERPECMVPSKVLFASFFFQEKGRQWAGLKSVGETQPPWSRTWRMMRMTP